MTTQLPITSLIESEVVDFFAGFVEIHTELGGPNTVEEAQTQLTERICALLAAYEQEPIGWMHEDELPENYPYDAMFPYSKVDIVRMFPVFAPSIPALGYDNIKAIESAISALKTTIKDARRFRYCLGALMNLDDEVAKLKVSASLSAPSIPAVPDMKSFEQVAEEVADNVGAYSIRDCIIASVWWNKCRAAMLQAEPVSQPYKLPDGWIPVSERLPEWKSDYRYIPLGLLLNGRTVVQGGFDDGSFWLDGVRISNVTAWQPLPAPPKGV